MSLIWKHVYRFIMVLMLLGASLCVNADSMLETVKDLRILERQSRSVDLPVLLLFAAQDCEYCEAIRENYLEPMIRSGQYSSSILFRQLYMDDFSYLRNRSGELISGDQIALKYDVEVAPTILFLDARGDELAERIVGITGADYFDKLLSSYISQARSQYQK